MLLRESRDRTNFDVTGGSGQEGIVRDLLPPRVLIGWLAGDDHAPWASPPKEAVTGGCSRDGSSVGEQKVESAAGDCGDSVDHLDQRLAGGGPSGEPLLHKGPQQ